MCKLYYVIFSALILLPTTFAHSQEPTVVVGQPATTSTGTFENAASPFIFHTLVSQQRSYCCSAVADNAVTVISEVAADSVVNGVAGPIPFATRGAMGPILAGPGGFNPTLQSRGCLIIPNNVQSIKFTIQARDGETSFSTLRISCDETTLIGGFNTAAGDFNFLEVTNNESDSIRVIATSSPASGSGNQGFTFEFGMLAGNPIERRDFDIHSLVGPSAFGGVVIAHDGTPGSIAVNLSQYKANTPQPGDFLKVGVVPFERPR